MPGKEKREAQKSPGPCFFSLATNPTKIDARMRSPPAAEWAWSGRVFVLGPAKGCLFSVQGQAHALPGPVQGAHELT